VAEPHQCQQCGGELRPDAPEGLCPRCLLARGVHDTVTASPSEAGGLTPGSVWLTPPEPAEVGEHFPQLEVLELIGFGGMGVVYKARQGGLDRLVALKVLPPAVGSEAAFAERFTREARSLARLNHPNIVTIYDFGQAGELYYFLMEYVDGASLRQMEVARRLSPTQALAIVPQICDALQYAHEEGIVHRDIKPENILLDRKGRVKIADFGLAKLLARSAGDYTLTRPRQMMGTPHYMAPEQMERPADVDHRADIYSLGVVFYEMLTGELPLGRFAAPSEKAPLDVRLDEVVLHSLEKEPDRRYQRVSEVKTDVESIGSTPAPPPLRAAPPSPPPPAVRPAVDREVEASGLAAWRKQLAAPAGAMLAAGLIAVVSGVLTPIIAIDEAHRIDEPDALVIVAQLLTVPIAVLAIVAFVGIRRLHYYGLAIAAAILLLIPLTPGWLSTLPMGIWILAALRRPGVKEAFARASDLRHPPAVAAGASEADVAAARRRAVLRRLAAPAGGLLAGGIIAVVSGAVVAICVLAEAYRIDEEEIAAVFFQFLTVPIVTLAVMGFLGMRRLNYYGLAITGGILLLIPLTPGWLVTMPLGIWVLVALKKPGVREAFARGGARGGPVSAEPGAFAMPAAQWQPPGRAVAAAPPGPAPQPWPPREDAREAGRQIGASGSSLPPPAPRPAVVGAARDARPIPPRRDPAGDMLWWLQRTRVGALLMIFGLGGFVLTDLAWQFDSFRTLSGLVTLLMLARFVPIVLWTAGVWVFTLRPPREPGWRLSQPARQVARWGLVAAGLLHGAAIVFHGLLPGELLPAEWGRLPTTIGLMVLSAVPQFFVLCYAGRLWRGQGRSGLAVQAACLAWLFPLSAALPALNAMAGRAAMVFDLYNVSPTLMGVLAWPGIAVHVWAAVVLLCYCLAQADRQLLPGAPTT